MGILIISSAALITLSALYRSYWSVRARWAYALAWMGSVTIILLWSGSLLYVGVAQCLIGAAMLIHLRIAHRIEL